MKHLCTPGLLAALLAIVPPSAGGATRGEWLIDYDEARKEAAATRRDLLINFSGSDWCELCGKLDREVFSRQEFQKAASKPFVLVQIDSPMDPENKAKIPPSLATRHDALREKFAIRDYPAIFLATSDGKPYARTGYRPGGANAYLKHLDSLLVKKRKRNELIARTEDAACQGLELARTLDEIITNTHPALAARYHREDMRRIVELDAGNTAGLKQKYERRLHAMDAADAMSTCHFHKAIRLYDTMATDLKLTGEELQNILLTKAQAHSYLRDDDGLHACLSKALKAAPTSKRAPGIEANLKRLFPETKPASSTAAP